MRPNRDIRKGHDGQFRLWIQASAARLGFFADYEDSEKNPIDYRVPVVAGVYSNYDDASKARKIGEFSAEWDFTEDKEVK